MRVREPYHLPPAKRPHMKRAKKLAWLTLWWTSTIAAVIFLTMGGSQAMKTAFVEDLLALVPPLTFLIATYVEERYHPNAKFPYGYYVLSTIAFFGAAVTLLGMGLYLLYDAITVLVSQDHPTIGLVELFGVQVWLGWLMIGANVYAGALPYILAQKKEPAAREIHSKVLYASARLDRADWLTAGATILGVLGIGLGFWWADAVAAAIISLDVAYDGYTNVKEAMEDLMGDVPTRVGEDEPDSVLARIQERLEAMEWVHTAQVRAREEGHVITGEAYVVPTGEDDLLRKAERAKRDIEELDWRLYDFSIVLVRELPKHAAAE